MPPRGAHRTSSQHSRSAGRQTTTRSGKRHDQATILNRVAFPHNQRAETQGLHTQHAHCLHVGASSIGELQLSVPPSLSFQRIGPAPCAPLPSTHARPLALFTRPPAPPQARPGSRAPALASHAHHHAQGQGQGAYLATAAARAKRKERAARGRWPRRRHITASAASPTATASPRLAASAFTPTSTPTSPMLPPSTASLVGAPAASCICAR